MKNYFLSIAAIVLAISFSAFSSEAPAKSKTFEQSLYWYYIQTDGDIGLPVDANLKTKSQVFSTVGCDDEASDDCARGYIDLQTFNTPAPAVDGDDEHIMDKL